MELNEEQMNQLVPAGIDFIRAVTEVLGPEQGIETWNAISEHLGNDIRGKIFFEMLSNEGSGSFLVLKRRGAVFDYRSVAVPIIKCIRTATGYGLKEAKDTYDRLVAGSEERIQLLNWRERRKYITDLRSMGIDVM